MVSARVEKGAIVSTDELYSYGLLTDNGYTRGVVKHGAKEFAYYGYRHGATRYTNHVESFCWPFKKLLASTHIQVSAKYMDHYLGKFTFCSNHHKTQNAKFDLLIVAPWPLLQSSVEGLVRQRVRCLRPPAG